jgi:hypothetical protein
VSRTRIDNFRPAALEIPSSRYAISTIQAAESYLIRHRRSSALRTRHHCHYFWHTGLRLAGPLTHRANLLPQFKIACQIQASVKLAFTAFNNPIGSRPRFRPREIKELKTFEGGKKKIHPPKPRQQLWQSLTKKHA